MSKSFLCNLCPKGYAWCVEDCDFDGICAECKEPLAPLKRRNPRDEWK